MTKFRQAGNQDGQGQRSYGWHLAFHPGSLFAGPSFRCPAIGLHAKPTAVWSMPAATQRTPATRPPDAFHWTTPRPDYPTSIRTQTDIKEINMIHPMIHHLYPELDLRQLEVVGHREGALRVIAGPGAGKTRVICLRGLNLLAAGRGPA